MPPGFLGRFAQSDEVRLAEETAEWARSVAGCVHVADAPLRQRARVAGVVRRITIRPVKGFEALEALIWDGTGEVAVTWLGRRSIPGLTLGSRLVVEGVLGGAPGGLTMVNPTFEFADSAPD